MAPAPPAVVPAGGASQLGPDHNKVAINTITGLVTDVNAKKLAGSAVVEATVDRLIRYLTDRYGGAPTLVWRQKLQLRMAAHVLHLLDAASLKIIHNTAYTTAADVELADENDPVFDMVRGISDQDCHTTLSAFNELGSGRKGKRDTIGATVVMDGYVHAGHGHACRGLRERSCEAADHVSGCLWLCHLCR